MAFHVSCPITCRRICDCKLGFPEGLRSARVRERFLEEVEAIEDFLSDPWSLREEATVQVMVPRVVTSAAVADGEDRAKRAALQQEAVEASAAVEDYVRKLETRQNDIDLVGEVIGGDGRDEQGFSGVKVIFRICFLGKNEGNAKAMKMLGCKTCDKKYHRSCLKIWAECI